MARRTTLSLGEAMAETQTPAGARAGPLSWAVRASLIVQMILGPISVAPALRVFLAHAPVGAGERTLASLGFAYAGPFYRAMILVGLVLAAAWLWRMARQIRRLDPQDAPWPPSLVIWFFVPLANLVMPPAQLRRLWLAAGAGRGWWVIDVWWVTVLTALAMTALGQILGRLIMTAARGPGANGVDVLVERLLAAVCVGAIAAFIANIAFLIIIIRLERAARAS